MENATATVTEYSLKASNGRHIRKATRVTFPDGRAVSFMEPMSKKRAIAQAENYFASERRWVAMLQAFRSEAR